MGIDGVVFLTGDYPFMVIGKDNSNNINCGIMDGLESKVVKAELANGYLSKLVVYSNNCSGGLIMNKSETNGNWRNCRYFKKDKEGNASFEGEFYEDIDFDGQFDVKSKWLKCEKKVLVNYIYVNDDWEEVNVVDTDNLEAKSLFVNGKFQKITKDPELVERLTALPRSVKEKVIYDFEFGKGWKRREEKK